MKIALVSFEYPPFYGGGIGTYAGIMSRWLARAGHEVHVVANGWLGAFEGADPAAEGIEGLTVHRIQALDRNYEPISPHDRLDDPLGNVCRRWEKALFWSVLVAQKLTEIHRDYGIEVVEFPECFAEGHTAFRWRETGVGLVDLDQDLGTCAVRLGNMVTPPDSCSLCLIGRTVRLASDLADYPFKSAAINNWMSAALLKPSPFTSERAT